MAIKFMKIAAACSLGMIACFASCSLNTYKLMNGRTKVPADTSVFSKRSLFDESLLRLIDTGVVYEEFNLKYGIIQRLDNNIETSYYALLRFYDNGCVNDFFIDRDEPFSPQNLNPRYSGHQGVFYYEKGRIRIQHFGQVDQRGGFGLLYSTIRISGDTLFEKRDDLDYEQIYIKRTLPDSFLIYKPYW